MPEQLDSVIDDILKRDKTAPVPSKPADIGKDTPTPKETPKSTPESIESVVDDILDRPYQFDTGKMLSNIIPNVIRNFTDLRHAPKGIAMLASEIAQSDYADVIKGRAGIRGLKASGYTERQTPLLSAIAEFYETHYDLISDEGRERFLKYLEENPVDVASDIVALATTFAGGAGAAIKGTKVATKLGQLDATLNASRLLKPAGSLAKPIKVAGRVAEVAMDPGSAAGRALGDIFQSLGRHKIEIDPQQDFLKQMMQALGQEGVALGAAETIFDAFSDGFEPYALKRQIQRDSGKLLSRITEDQFKDLNKIADRLTKTKRKKTIGEYIEKGRELIKYGTGYAGYQIGEWELMILGAAGGELLSMMLAKYPNTIKYILASQPPDWAKYVAKQAKKTAVQTGRATQRVSRVQSRRPYTSKFREAEYVN